jgi:putative ABC transport system permease protein
MTKDVIDMFSLKMIRGGANSMDDPSGIIINASTAKTLFGDRDPINQTIQLNNKFNVRVTGVFQDVAPNSVFGQVRFIGNIEHLKNTMAILLPSRLTGVIPLPISGCKRQIM